MRNKNEIKRFSDNKNKGIIMNICRKQNKSKKLSKRKRLGLTIKSLQRTYYRKIP